MSDCCATKERSHAMHDHDATKHSHGVAPVKPGAHQHTHHRHVVTDPVRGMAVDVTEKTPKSEHAGRTYHFCSARCLQKFEAEPSRYTTASVPQKAEPAPSGVKWTC